MEDTPSCRSITFLSHDREEGEEAGSGRAARREAGIAKEKESLLNGPPFFLRSSLTYSKRSSAKAATDDDALCSLARHSCTALRSMNTSS